ncbi:MAG TPA: hypothetical protein VGF26_16180, partial [Ramlibacter sp.]
MATGSGEDKFRARFAGDRATAPTPLEDGSDHTWQEFIRLQTEPASLTSQGSSSDGQQDLPRAGEGLTLESTM